MPKMVGRVSTLTRQRKAKNSEIASMIVSSPVIDILYLMKKD